VPQYITSQTTTDRPTQQCTNSATIQGKPTHLLPFGERRRIYETCESLVLH